MRFVFVFFVVLLTSSARAADVHGASDTFAGEGVAIVWGVLRGESEESTIVVLRLAADARRYRRVEVAGIDPFTRDTKIRFAASAIGAGLDVRLPRAGFADHPRTELRFSGGEALLVYYLGIPDTAPEFTTAGALEAHFAARMSRLQLEGKLK